MVSALSMGCPQLMRTETKCFRIASRTENHMGVVCRRQRMSTCDFGKGLVQWKGPARAHGVGRRNSKFIASVDRNPECEQWPH